MSSKTKKIYLFYFITLATTAVATVSLRTVALFTELEPTIGFYKDPTLSIATAAFLCTAVALLAILTHELRELFVFVPDYRDMPSLLSGSFLAVALCFFAVMLAVGALPMAPAALVTALLAAVAAVVGAPLFLLRLFSGAAHGTRQAMLTLALAFLGVLYAAYLGFEGSIMIAAPAKLLATAAWVLATFFFLGEARVALERPRWALHTCVTALTALFFAALSIPNLIYHAASGTSLLGNTAHDFLAFAIFLYTLARLSAVFASAHREGTPEIRYATAPMPTEGATAHKEGNTEESTDEEATDR